MSVVVIGRINSEYGTELETYLRDIKSQSGVELEIIDPDTPEGISLCESYGIYEYPTFLARREDSGSALATWSGKTFPMINEILYYAH